MPGDLGNPLGLVVHKLSDKNYAQSLACYRFWFDVGWTYCQSPPDQLFDAIWTNRAGGSTNLVHGTTLIHPTAHLIVRFASDLESDLISAPHSSGLQTRLCTTTLREFFKNNLAAAWYKENGYSDGAVPNFFVDANLIARWANLGYIEEASTCNHILRSLISHPDLYNHQADALIILFKLAGATFEEYADLSVVNRCFDLLKGHYGCGSSGRGLLVRVRAPR